MSGFVEREASSSRHASAPRVSQVDAEELDNALVGMLGEKIGRALSNFRVSTALLGGCFADYNRTWRRSTSSPRSPSFYSL